MSRGARVSMATASGHTRHRCAISSPFLVLSLGGSCAQNGQRLESLLAPLGGLRASHRPTQTASGIGGGCGSASPSLHPH